LSLSRAGAPWSRVQVVVGLLTLAAAIFVVVFFGGQLI
jgi:hypothetical protein